MAQRQVQPIALRVTTQDSSHSSLSLLTRTTPTPATVLSQHYEVRLRDTVTNISTLHVQKYSDAPAIEDNKILFNGKKKKAGAAERNALQKEIH